VSHTEVEEKEAVGGQQRPNIQEALYSEGESQVKFDNGLSHGHFVWPSAGREVILGAP
jgi:hypothetical protein